MMCSNNQINRPKCGDIWMCNLPSHDGSIQNGYRPVFILSNNKNNRFSHTVNIIPLTTKMNKRKLPVHVELWDYQRFGLKAPSTMLIEQIMTITLDNLDRYIGEVDDTEILNAICSAIVVQFPVMAAQ